jgi:ribA/ribD-fused uncharacterized protein
MNINTQKYFDDYKKFLDQSLNTIDFKKGLKSLWFENNNFIMFYFQTGSKIDYGNALKYKTFSNFHPTNLPCDILGDDYKNIYAKSSEHIYQAAKFTNNKSYATKILKCYTPHLAAKLGRDKSIPGYDKNWEIKKFDIMVSIIQVKYKFCQEFREELLSSGTKILIENTNLSSNKDAVWGCGKDGRGQNYLGLALMIVRDLYSQMEKNQ